MSKKKRDSEPEEEPEEESDDENLTPWEKQQRKKGKDPDEFQKEYTGLAREMLDALKADKKKGGMLPMMFAQESKELREAYAELNRLDWDERCALSIAKVLAQNNSNSEQVAQTAFDIVQAVKAKFKTQKEDVQAKIKKEQEKSPADHGTMMGSPVRLPPNANGDI